MFKISKYTKFKMFVMIKHRSEMKSFLELNDGMFRAGSGGRATKCAANGGGQVKGRLTFVFQTAMAT